MGASSAIVVEIRRLVKLAFRFIITVTEWDIVASKLLLLRGEAL